MQPTSNVSTSSVAQFMALARSVVGKICIPDAKIPSVHEAHRTRVRAHSPAHEASTIETSRMSFFGRAEARMVCLHPFELLMAA